MVPKLMGSHFWWDPAEAGTDTKKFKNHSLRQFVQIYTILSVCLLWTWTSIDFGILHGLWNPMDMESDPIESEV